MYNKINDLQKLRVIGVICLPKLIVGAIRRLPGHSKGVL